MAYLFARARGAGGTDRGGEETAAAEVLYRESLRLYRERGGLGEDHPYVSAAVRELGDLRRGRAVASRTTGRGGGMFS